MTCKRTMVVSSSRKDRGCSVDGDDIWDVGSALFVNSNIGTQVPILPTNIL
jgi:hypothetical protein